MGCPREDRSALGESHNRHPETCHYYLNDRTDLARFDDTNFDFIYSNIVLQHMQPRDQRRNLAELVRLLAPGGIFVFQLLSAPLPVPDPTGGWPRLKQRIKSITHRSSSSRTGACVEN